MVFGLWLGLPQVAQAQPPLAEQFLRQPTASSPAVFWGAIGHRWERYQALELGNPLDAYPEELPLIWVGPQTELGFGTDESQRIGAQAMIRSAESWFWYGASVAVSTDFSDAQVQPSELVAGLRHGSWSFWGGLRSRWIGNGRYGNLLYGDQIKPIPSVVLDWTQPGRAKWGRLYAELGLGQMMYPRGDVNRPLLLHMDFRYQPLSWLELSATRLSLMGGEGRPLPSLGQMILPSDPHIENDPNQLLPDQDELACLEAYGRFAFDKVGPVTGLEIWFQYGAEDAIQKRLGVLPYVSLAGVASMGGLSLHAQEWRLSFEAADIVDDRFRWYHGHRIYHEGFSVEEEWMGYPSGGDAYSWAMGLGWFQANTGAELRYHNIERIGAIQSVNGQSYALMQNEVQRGIGGEYWHSIGQNRLSLQANIAQINHAEFIPHNRQREGRMTFLFSRAWELP